MDWEQHKYGDGVEVIFTPRVEYKGRPALPELFKRSGARIKVRTLWHMDEGDPYPGEWALGAAECRGDVLGRAWIASGDVTLAQ